MNRLISLIFILVSTTVFGFQFIHNRLFSVDETGRWDVNAPYVMPDEDMNAPQLGTNQWNVSGLIRSSARLVEEGEKSNVVEVVEYHERIYYEGNLAYPHIKASVIADFSSFRDFVLKRGVARQQFSRLRIPEAIGKDALFGFGSQETRLVSVDYVLMTPVKMTQEKKFGVWLKYSLYVNTSGYMACMIEVVSVDCSQLPLFIGTWIYNIADTMPYECAVLGNAGDNTVYSFSCVDNNEAVRFYIGFDGYNGEIVLGKDAINNVKIFIRGKTK